jgi:hypothetical protein
MGNIARCPHCETTACWSCGGPLDIAPARYCRACIAGGKPFVDPVPCCQQLRGAVQAMRDAMAAIRVCDHGKAHRLLYEAVEASGVDPTTGRGQ